MEKEKEENMENKDAIQLYLSSVKAVLEKLGEFLTEKTTWSTKYRRRGMIYLKRLKSKNEEISQKRETHSHKLNEVHEAYMDLKVPEKDIFYL